MCIAIVRARTLCSSVHFCIAKRALKMSGLRSKLVLPSLILAILVMTHVSASPITRFDICIQNCAQCVRMLEDSFDGKLCADTCVEFKGQTIPDCERLESISPFLVKIA